MRADHDDAVPAPPDTHQDDHEPKSPPRIQRFLAGERMLHWALAVPYLLLYGTALMMLIFYGEPHPRRFREAFALLHRVVGVALIVLPPIALLRGAADWRAHLENLREGWYWTRDDTRWLLLFPRAAMNPKIKLPEEDKFNAAEKLNFMMLSVTYPLYITTGLMVWMPGVAFFPYLAHITMAVLGLPLVMGHIFMAAVNPATRVGLSGMVTGWVDREWARHHYRRWYRERFEASERQQEVRSLAGLLLERARVRCDHCHHVAEFGSWRELLERAFKVEPIVCPGCLEPIHVIEPEATPEIAEAIMRHLEGGGVKEPYTGGGIEAA